MSLVVSSSAFLDKTYDEAVALLVEARNYIAFQESQHQRGRDVETRLLISQETMRITSRLTQVMAWLFCQRAVQAGEISAQEARSERFALSGQDVCLNDLWSGDARLPIEVRQLLDKSLALYMRVTRLSELASRPMPERVSVG